MTVDRAGGSVHGTFVGGGGGISCLTKLFPGTKSFAHTLRVGEAETSASRSKVLGNTDSVDARNVRISKMQLLIYVTKYLLR
jgi:hypothetical protein